MQEGKEVEPGGRVLGGAQGNWLHSNINMEAEQQLGNQTHLHTCFSDSSVSTTSEDGPHLKSCSRNALHPQSSSQHGGALCSRKDTLNVAARVRVTQSIWLLGSCGSFLFPQSKDNRTTYRHERQTPPRYGNREREHRLWEMLASVLCCAPRLRRATGRLAQTLHHLSVV